jgi:hypothetical protein
MQLSPVQIAIVVYAAIYFILASSMEAQNIGLGYPFVYIGTSMVAQLLVVAGIFLFALNASEHYFTLWRWIFPLLTFNEFWHNPLLRHVSGTCLVQISALSCLR